MLFEEYQKLPCKLSPKYVVHVLMLDIFLPENTIFVPNLFSWKHNNLAQDLNSDKKQI